MGGSHRVALALGCACAFVSGCKKPAPPPPPPTVDIVLQGRFPARAELHLGDRHARIKRRVIGTAESSFVTLEVPRANAYANTTAKLTYDSPCGPKELSVPLGRADGTEHHAKYVVDDITLGLNLKPVATVWLDPRAADGHTVTVGAQRVALIELRQHLFDFDCPDGTTVRVDGKPIGQLKSETSHPPSALIVPVAGFCYRANSVGYGSASSARGGLLKGPGIFPQTSIDYFLIEAPGSVDGKFAASRSEVVGVDCTTKRVIPYAPFPRLDPID